MMLWGLVQNPPILHPHFVDEETEAWLLCPGLSASFTQGIGLRCQVMQRGTRAEAPLLREGRGQWSKQ